MVEPTQVRYALKVSPAVTDAEVKEVTETNLCPLVRVSVVDTWRVAFNTLVPEGLRNSRMQLEPVGIPVTSNITSSKVRASVNVISPRVPITAVPE